MKKQIFTLVVALMTVSTLAVASMGHWRFDEGAGDQVLDSSGNGNHGRLQDIKWIMGPQNSAAQVEWANGNVLNLGNDDSLVPTGDLTVQAWIKPWAPDFGKFPTIVIKEGSYKLGLTPNKALALSLWINGEKQSFQSTPQEWKNGQWQHVAAVYSGEKVELYLNGALNATHPVTKPGSISKTSGNCFIGSFNGGHTFRGTIDEVILDGEALSSRELALVHNAGEYEMARRDNRFTDFYEKLQKRSAKPLVPGTLWIDTEDFTNYGGWWMDTQFVPQMGSPYLMAAGIGNPVEDASTVVNIPEAGTYRLWVRNKNWIADFGDAPGKFQVLVDGTASKTTFGTRKQCAWVWQDGGTFELTKGETELKLHDLTGYYGRCDAMILTTDLEFAPRQEQKDYLAERARFVGTIPVKEMGHFDFIVVGGGVAGCNAAIAAARGGANVALIQDRPMLGGNNSAEMGVPVSGGASCGKGRETGLNEEIGRVHAYNYLSKWASGADLVAAKEPNLTVFLNSHVFKAEMDGDRITAVTAFDMLDGHHTRYTADIFADCTGDGWLGYYAGAEFTLGRESREMFGEEHGADIADTVTMSGSLMQNAILGYQAIDMGKPVSFTLPSWAYDFTRNAKALEGRPRFERGIRAGNWWHENHGRNDDLWDPEFARDDLIRVELSYFNWIKNQSPLAEKAKNFQLKFIPVTNAKRETRRLIGDHFLIETEIMNKETFEDRVGYFVWGLDVHHPDGIFSKEGPFDYHPTPKPNHMPYRILYSKNIANMFMAGRNVSVSHIALGTARVQGTTGVMGQIIGTAAAFCKKYSTNPRGVYESHIPELQQQLMKDDLTIFDMKNLDPGDLARSATAMASSSITDKDGAHNVNNGLIRPMDEDEELWIEKSHPNMWISDPVQSLPQWIELDFGTKKEVNSVYLTFDTSLAEKRYVTWQFKAEERMPTQCVRDYQVQVATRKGWKTVADVKNNYQRRRIHRFPAESTAQIRVLVSATNGDKSARIYEIRAYNE